MLRIGVTGGIGSGKSTVCRMLEECGAVVYDSDSNAKRLMSEDAEIRKLLTAEFGEETFVDGTLNRRHLASVVFADAGRLQRLNEIVHPAVRRDFRLWCERHNECSYAVLESAILFDAGFETEVDKTLAVVAPLELRIARVCSRDGMARDEVEKRISRQMSDDELCAKADYTVANISLEYLRSDVGQLDKIFRYEAHIRDMRS